MLRRLSYIQGRRNWGTEGQILPDRLTLSQPWGEGSTDYDHLITTHTSPQIYRPSNGPVNICHGYKLQLNSSYPILTCLTKLLAISQQVGHKIDTQKQVCLGQINRFVVRRTGTRKKNHYCLPRLFSLILCTQLIYRAIGTKSLWSLPDFFLTKSSVSFLHRTIGHLAVKYLSPNFFSLTLKLFFSFSLNFC